MSDPPGAKALTGRRGHRVGKGHYRVLYTVDDRARTVRIYRIGHRLVPSPIPFAV